MSNGLLELLPELVELAIFGLGSLSLSVAGAYVERFAFLTVGQGDIQLGAWAVVMGAAMFYFAYLLGTDKAYPKLQAVKTALAE